MLKRRDFLKKGFLGGLAYSLLPATSIPSLASPLKEEMILQDPNDWEKVRSQLIYKGNAHFFNTASYGFSPKTVVSAFSDSIFDLERKGRDGRYLFKSCRDKLAKTLNAHPDEIAITRNTTEGMNIMARAIGLKKGDEVILSKHEHVGGASPWLALKKEVGIEVKTIELDLSGEDNLNLLKNSISKQTKAISISHLLCTTGMVLPLKEIIEFCKENKIFSCIDGAQALGSIPIDLGDLDPDFYAASGHKWMFGPKGTGVLFINKSVIKKCDPTFVGAYTDSNFDLNALQLEYRKVAEREEYGTRNASIVAGLEAAIDFHNSIGIKAIMQRGADLRELLRKEIQNRSAIEILSPKDPKYASSILTFRFRTLDNKEIVKQLRSKEKIVLRHIYENQLDAIRVSLSVFNSEEEVEQLANALKKI